MSRYTCFVTGCFVLIAHYCTAMGTYPVSPWTDSQLAKTFIEYFVDSLRNSGIFNQFSIDDISYLVYTLVPEVDRIASKGNPSENKLRRWNTWFSSSVADAISSESSNMDLETKLSATERGMVDAFKKTVGAVDEVFLKEIRKLIALFAKEKSKNKKVDLPVNVDGGRSIPSNEGFNENRKNHLQTPNSYVEISSSLNKVDSQMNALNLKSFRSSDSESDLKGQHMNKINEINLEGISVKEMQVIPNFSQSENRFLKDNAGLNLFPKYGDENNVEKNRNFDETKQRLEEKQNVFSPTSYHGDIFPPHRFIENDEISPNPLNFNEIGNYQQDMGLGLNQNLQIDSQRHFNNENFEENVFYDKSFQPSIAESSFLHLDNGKNFPNHNFEYENVNARAIASVSQNFVPFPFSEEVSLPQNGINDEKQIFGDYNSGKQNFIPEQVSFGITNAEIYDRNENLYTDHNSFPSSQNLVSKTYPTFTVESLSVSNNLLQPEQKYLAAGIANVYTSENFLPQPMYNTQRLGNDVYFPTATDYYKTEDFKGSVNLENSTNSNAMGFENKSFENSNSTEAIFIPDQVFPEQSAQYFETIADMNGTINSDVTNLLKAKDVLNKEMFNKGKKAQSKDFDKKQRVKPHLEKILSNSDLGFELYESNGTSIVHENNLNGKKELNNEENGSVYRNSYGDLEKSKKYDDVELKEKDYEKEIDVITNEIRELLLKRSMLFSKNAIKSNVPSLETRLDLEKTNKRLSLMIETLAKGNYFNVQGIPNALKTAYEKLQNTDLFTGEYDKKMEVLMNFCSSLVHILKYSEIGNIDMDDTVNSIKLIDDAMVNAFH